MLVKPGKDPFMVVPGDVEITMVPPLLAFVLMELVEVNGAVATVVAIIRRTATWDNPELINCNRRMTETGMANVRSKARHWPRMMFRSLNGVARSSSTKPLRRASTKKRQD